MAEIRPFRGVHYNRSLIKDGAKVVCPPYDIINPQQQQELYRRSEYNFIRIEFGQELPQDTATDNKYTRSAATLDDWLKRGILEIDETPSIYLHDHHFSYQGRKFKRCSLIASVRAEEWNKGVIRPHEGTLTEPRGDRLSLLRALRANTSPILALFEDRGERISSLSANLERSRPLISFEDVNGEKHTVRAITDSEVVSEITASLAEQPLYIADGHHRYESALAYRRERLAVSSSDSGNKAFNFVMMELVDFSDPGLLILPPYRLVRGIPKPVLDGLMTKLKILFEIEELPLSLPDVWEQADALLNQSGENRLILFGPDRENLFLLQLRPSADSRQMMPYFHSELYKKLDVSIIDHIILENLLALDSEKEKTSLAYSYDRTETLNRVLVQEYQLAFLFRPIRVETIKAIADTGDKMPRKSTYFYPKLPSGLILHLLS
ncbi:MAG: DUF1015 domain-containing protein [Dehalococcoidales bacterium]|nr:DUF1015 domain-containing protein [Dehalococcoidales bacterium]